MEAISDGKVAVFSAFRPFLHILATYDLKNVQNQHHRSVIPRLAQAIAISIMLFGLAIGYVGDMWYCIQHNFIVSQTALQIGLLVNTLQVVISYTALRIKYDDIDDVIADITGIVEKSEENGMGNFNYYQFLF